MIRLINQFILQYFICTHTKKRFIRKLVPIFYKNKSFNEYVCENCGKKIYGKVYSTTGVDGYKAVD